MSLVARKILNKLRLQQHIKYSSLANKVGLTSNCENCTINNSQYELLKLNIGKNYLNRCTLSQMYVTSSVHYNFKEVAYNFLSKFNFNKRTETLVWGYHWFATLDKLNYEEFFKLLEIPDTFYSWFKITELHVWMISVKILNENESTMLKRDGLIEAMWEDAEKRAEVMHVSSKQRKADFAELYYRCKASLLVYDEGFLSNDMEFASALWYQFFDKKCEDPRILEALISYCRAQISHLFTVDLSPKGVLPKDCKVWLPLKPHFKYKT